jgi:capsular polysaccharide biosynthesis protein
MPANCVLSLSKKDAEVANSLLIADKIHGVAVKHIKLCGALPPWIRTEYVLNERYIYQVSNCTVYPLSGAVVLNETAGRGEKVLVESIGSLLKTMTFSDLKTESVRPRSRNHRVGHVVPLAGGRGGHYHWLLESLPGAIRCHERCRDAPFLVSSERAGYVDQSLALLFGDSFSVVSVPDGAAVECDKVTFYSKSYGAANFHPDDVMLVRTKLLDACSLRPRNNIERKIYISRRLAANRKCDETSVEEFFVRKGYDVVFPETLTFVDQIQLFSEASHIAGLHGAGLANILFAPEGARVVELFRGDYLNDCYARLASTLGYSYGFQVSRDASRLAFDWSTLEQIIES